MSDSSLKQYFTVNALYCAVYYTAVVADSGECHRDPS